MASVLPILMFPEQEQLLHTPSVQVRCFDEALADFCQQMIDTMNDAEGIGLAAVQVGQLKRLFVMQTDDQPQIFINPEIIDVDDELIDVEEGCLSIPTIRATVKRHKTIQIKAQNAQGVAFEATLNAMASICFQHELDHLNGTLFIDHLSRFKQLRIRNKLLKLNRQINP